jgi:acyl-CoA reductase-like NAD-dependent aldehyde dehydrogenase
MAALITAEMGSPITFSTYAQVGLPGAMLGALGDVAAKHTWEEVRPGHFGADVVIRKEPVGVVAAVVPWNYPQFLIVSKLAPALLAGCAVVLKPAPETPLDALLLAEMLDEVGLPPGVVSILPGDGAIGGHLVGHPGVDKVSFTGSTAAGRKVAAACAANLTRVSLELGGKSAAVVLDDADPATVATGVQFAALVNSGQTCVAQSRVLVPESRYDEVVDALAWSSATLRTGRPRSGRWSPGGNSSGSATTWRSAGRRAPAWWRAAPTCPTASRGAGTFGRPCSPTSTTACASPATRSSGRSSP